MSKALIPLEPGVSYHIFNHSVGNENIFRTDKNYLSFLKGFKTYMFPYADLMCYCLMRNHFHLIVRFRSHDEIEEFINNADKTLVNGKLKVISDEKLTLLLSQQFSNYFNSYAKAYNMENFRRGALFKRAFRRIPIQTDDYMKRLIRYIHQNPVNDSFASTIEEWKYSSYNSILSINHTLIPRMDVIELFGDLENFIFYHQQNDAGFEY